MRRIRLGLVRLGKARTRSRTCTSSRSGRLVRRRRFLLPSGESYLLRFDKKGGMLTIGQGAHYAARGLPKPRAVFVHYGWFDMNASTLGGSLSPVPYSFEDLLKEPVSTGWALA